MTFVTHTLRSEGADASEDGTGRGVPLVTAFDWQSGGDVEPHVSAESTSALQANQTPAVHQGLVVRRLMPIECLRLQGLPDDYLDDLGLSDSAKYRLIGNGVAAPVIEWIGRRILQEAS